MTTPTADMSRIERSVWIHAPRARVWRALADVAEFSAWFRVNAEGQFAPGARIRMTSTHPGYEHMTFFVTVEEVVPERAFSWRWHPGSQQPPEDSNEPTTLVQFRLDDEKDGTRVTVVESGFDRIALARRETVYKENTGGWEFQLGALDRYVGHGA
jgi:uncharacterized protein YndB with AHSA1/START domain